MTLSEIVALRKSGCVEQAYDAIRQIYATDKSQAVKSVLFWTAYDMMNQYVAGGYKDEAESIYKALLRLHSDMTDTDRRAAAALARAGVRFDHEQGVQTGTHNRRLGQWGEEVAAQYLREKGYSVLANDWRSQHRDIDLVCADGGTIVFVEVKTRSNGSDLSSPEDAIDAEKMRNLRAAFYHYLHQHRWIDHPFRFDIVTVIGHLGDKEPAIKHWVDVGL